MSVFAFGVSRKRLEQAVRELGVPVTVARELDEADAVVTLRNYYQRKPAALRDAESHGVPIYVLKTNTILQMENMLAIAVRPGGRTRRRLRCARRPRPSGWCRRPAGRSSSRHRTRTSGGCSTRWPRTTR